WTSSSPGTSRSWASIEPGSASNWRRRSTGPSRGGVTATSVCAVAAPEPESQPPEQPGLARRLGTGDAVVIGLGSMIGAGVFAAFAPAAEAAGAGLLIGLGIAA